MDKEPGKCDSCNSCRDYIADMLWEIDGSEISQDREYYIQKALTIMVRCNEWVNSECWRDHYK